MGNYIQVTLTAEQIVKLETGDEVEVQGVDEEGEEYLIYFEPEE